MEFDPENPFEESILSLPTLFEIEPHFMADADYSKNVDVLTPRQEAISIVKHYARSGFMEPVIPFLALNYYDRLISRKPTLLEGEQENLILLTTCCFTIAGKMRSDEFFVADFLHEQELNYDMDQIYETEILILSELKWRTRSVTALCFLDFFLGFIEMSDDNKDRLKNYATQKIYRDQYDIFYTEFKPSIIAASALLTCCCVRFREKISKPKEAMASCQYVEPESLYYCLGPKFDDAKTVPFFAANLDETTNPTSSANLDETTNPTSSVNLDETTTSNPSSSANLDETTTSNPSSSAKLDETTTSNPSSSANFDETTTSNPSSIKALPSRRKLITSMGDVLRRSKKEDEKTDKTEKEEDKIVVIDDDMLILEGIIEYHSTNGTYPFESTTTMLNFLQNTLSLTDVYDESSVGSFMTRIDLLKKDYRKTLAEKGVDPEGLELRDRKFFDLSHVIWGCL